MRILVVSLLFPLKHHAGGRFVYELLKHLSEKHEMHLVTRIEKNEFSAIDTISRFCKAVYPYAYASKSKRGLADNIRLFMNYIGFAFYARKLARGNHFDIIHAEWVESALMLKKKNIPMLLDAHDVITKPAERIMKKSRGVQRLFNYLRYILLKRIEIRIMRKFDVIFTRSEFDRNYLLSMSPDSKVEILPHPAGLDMTGKEFKRQKNTILFLASYRHRKVNVDAALYFYNSVFPLIRKSIPDAVFIAAGYDPPEELTSLQRNDPNIIVPGFVEDLEETYKTASVFVAPILIGGGIMLKILDAMASGTPVVATSYGNEGIGAAHGRDLFVADNAEDFAESVLRLLRDNKLSEYIAANAMEFVRKNYSKEKALDTIESAYNEVLP